MTIHSLRLLPCLAALALAGTASSQGPGYTDTPQIPGQKWRVHDAARPRPVAVDPGPEQPPAPVPADAIVLFDGTDLDAWQKGNGDAAEWKLVDSGGPGAEGVKAMEVNRTGAIQTRESFGSCQLHVEWCAPAEVKGESQGRGNSGVFLMGRYEIQVLDSYENPSYADGQAAAIYGQKPPEVNACRPPGQWQSYDIFFTAPRFDGDDCVSPAYVTVVHNGILVQNHVAFMGPTQHRQTTSYSPHPAKLPIQLQDHGNPVRFRNLWIRPMDEAPAAGEQRDG